LLLFDLFSSTTAINFIDSIVCVSNCQLGAIFGSRRHFGAREHELAANKVDSGYKSAESVTSQDKQKPAAACNATSENGISARK
jgi:hypothetical protein